MNIYHLSKREKTLFLAVITVIALAFFFKFIAEPLFAQWKTLNDQIKSKAAYIAKNKRLLSRYKSLEEEYVKFPSLSEGVESEEKEVAKALAAIEGISKLSSCYIQNVKPRASKKIAGYREISFDVTTEGTIVEFSRFLYEIEASKEMLRVKHFTITSKSRGPGNLKGIFLVSKIIIY